MEDKIKEIILSVCGGDAFEEGVDLIESGILDSLAFIELLSEFEDIGIEIQPTRVDKNEFRTVDGIVKLALRYQLL